MELEEFQSENMEGPFTAWIFRCLMKTGPVLGRLNMRVIDTPDLLDVAWLRQCCPLTHGPVFRVQSVIADISVLFTGLSALETITIL